jgi:hypothetical protein
MDFWETKLVVANRPEMNHNPANPQSVGLGISKEFDCVI